MTDINHDHPNSKGQQYFAEVVSGQSAVDALRGVLPNKELADTAARKGALWVRRKKANGQMGKLQRLYDLTEDLIEGSELIANINVDVLAAVAPAPILIDQQKNYSFWYKPRGVLSQGSKWGDHTAMPSLVAKATGSTTHLVHRLDREACGIMVVAHTRPAVKALSALFAKRQVTKRYQVLVEGEWEESVPREFSEPLDDKKALTVVESTDSTKNAKSTTSTKNTTSTKTVTPEEHHPSENTKRTLCNIRLHTGRKHQIRRHLSSAGFPVVGDRRYGNSESQELLALMATHLEFECPFAQRVVSATVPDELLNELRGSLT